MQAFFSRSAIALILVSGAALAAGASVDLKPMARSIPAMPATSVAAAAGFPAARWDQMPEASPLVADLQQKITAATMQLNAPTPAAAAAFDPANAQAMAAKMQSMSQAEQVAFAMQMQQQMMGGMNRPSSGVVSPKEGEALKQIGNESSAMVNDQTRLNALRASHVQFLDGWVAADNAISARNAKAENFGDGGGTEFVCSEAERAGRLKAVSLHLKLAGEQLAMAAKLDQEQRAFNTSAIARYDRVIALGAQISNPGTAALGNGARSNSFSTASGAIAETAQLYDQAGRRAAWWQHMDDSIRKLRVVSCKDAG